jgi:hypothetical protein
MLVWGRALRAAPMAIIECHESSNSPVGPAAATISQLSARVIATYKSRRRSCSWRNS